MGNGGWGVMLPAGGYPPGIMLLNSLEPEPSGLVVTWGWNGRGFCVLLGGRYSRSVPCLTANKNYIPLKTNKIKQ